MTKQLESSRLIIRSTNGVNRMRDYLCIFDEVVQIIKNDYAGKEEKRGWDNPEMFRGKIIEKITSEKIDDEIFYEIVDDYLTDLKDGHVIWHTGGAPMKNCGFRVRRFENCLYVIDVLVKESNVEKGWKIIQIDGMDIKEFAIQNNRKLKSDILERQKWHGLISSANTLTFQLDNGDLKKYTVQNFKFSRREAKYELTRLNDEILYMCFEDFANPDAILKLIEQNRALIDQTPYWIIDVRNNAGGADTAYYPLLPYIFSKGETRKAEEQYYLMTENNCDTRVEFLEEYIKNWDDKEEINKFIELMVRNRGKGFIKVEFDVDPRFQTFIETMVNPKQVVVMTDTYCGSSGDQFIYDVKQAKKVTVIGRPTTGILDYSNLAAVKLDDLFQLMYPTSKVASVMDQQFTNDGIEPDIYISWTPQHIVSDIDMLKALEILNDFGKVKI